MADTRKHVTLVHWTVGRLGLMVGRFYVGEKYGRKGSRGWEFQVSAWVNPGKSRG